MSRGQMLCHNLSLIFTATQGGFHNDSERLDTCPMSHSQEVREPVLKLSSACSRQPLAPSIPSTWSMAGYRITVGETEPLTNDFSLFALGSRVLVFIGGLTFSQLDCVSSGCWEVLLRQLKVDAFPGPRGYTPRTLLLPFQRDRLWLGRGWLARNRTSYLPGHPAIPRLIHWSLLLPPPPPQLLLGMLGKILATSRARREVHFIQKAFTEYLLYLALSHQLAKIPWYPLHLTPSTMHSHDFLSSLPFTTRLLSKKSSPLLVTISTYSTHFRAPFLYYSYRLESLDFSEPWFLYQRVSPFRRERSTQPVYTHLTYSDPLYYLEGSHFTSFLEISADTYCVLDNVLEEEDGGKDKIIPVLEKQPWASHFLDDETKAQRC